MLIYPLDLSWDQKGNAQKIEFHGLGLSGNFKTNGLKEIEEKIMKLLTDHSYNQNVEEFYKKCTSIGSYHKNIPTILNFINSQL